jgi:hypothetical protein
VTQGRRETLRRTYLRLGSGELAAAAAFVFVCVTVVIPRLGDRADHAALWSALIPLLVVLVQAGAYWLLARGWVAQRPMPAAFAGLYHLFRVADAVLLIVGLAGLLAWFPDRPGAAVTVVAIWGFGVVEYINYFLVRLSYPIPRWFTMVGQWRTPQLIRDIGSAKR